TTVSSWPLPSSSRARFHPTLPAPTIRTYMAGLGGGLPDRLGEHFDRHGRRADRLQPLLAVPLRPRRVEHAHDNLRNVEAALGDLSDDEVGVVAVGRSHERVRALDARLDQRVRL